jgi:hypothetical protein
MWGNPQKLEGICGIKIPQARVSPDSSEHGKVGISRVCEKHQRIA